jgi:acetylglutamate kinase
MVAKLQACRAALQGGVRDVVIADGRRARLGTLADPSAPLSACTQVTR